MAADGLDPRAIGRAKSVDSPLGFTCVGCRLQARSDVGRVVNESLTDFSAVDVLISKYLWGSLLGRFCCMSVRMQKQCGSESMTLLYALLRGHGSLMLLLVHMAKADQPRAIQSTVAGIGSGYWPLRNTSKE